MISDGEVSLIFVPDGKAKSISVLENKVDAKTLAASGGNEKKPEEKKSDEPVELSKKALSKLKKKEEKKAKKEANKTDAAPKEEAS